MALLEQEDQFGQLLYEFKKRNWEEVLKIFGDYPEIRAARIDRDSNTALHAAITNGAPDSIIGKMVDLIEVVAAMEDTDADTDTDTPLSARNKKGDTPLHCAAARGSVYICQCIVAVDQSLIERRNEKGETPLFLTALNDRKDAFFYLHNICKESSSDLWRRANGDTILHCTIHRTYFDLSLQIIHLCEYTVYSYNQEGETPLHILASTPSAFLSGTRLNWLQKLCYKFIRVEELKFESLEAYKAVDVVGPEPSKSTDQIQAPDESHWNILFLESVRRKKERHVWGHQIMEKLVKLDSWYEYIQGQKNIQVNSDIDKFKYTPRRPDESPNNTNRDPGITAIKYGVIEMVKILKGKTNKDVQEMNKIFDDDIDMLMRSNTTREPSTPLLTAVKYGLTELVDKILEDEPEAIYDTNNADNKNIVLVAVEERQSSILKKVKKHRLWNEEEELKYAVDIHGNNALHLAAKFSEGTTWELPMSAMHMQWEVMWFEWVRKMLPDHFSYAKNYKEEETPSKIFGTEHKGLAEDSNQWLKDSSGSYTVASTIITSITYSTSYQFLGGSKDNTGVPNLIGNLIFDTFALATLIAFTFSITALAAFLALYGSQKQPKEYSWRIPMTLLIGLASLFVSMFATLVSFYAAHSLEVDRKKFPKVLPLYAFTLVPACFYIATQIPLFVAVLRASISSVPHSASIKKAKDAPS